MSLKAETVVFEVCGNCMYSKGEPAEHEELRKLEMAYPRYEESRSVPLSLLRRQANRLRDAKVLCSIENTEMGFFEEACTIWKKK